jgi:hypothetical protein
MVSRSFFNFGAHPLNLPGLPNIHTQESFMKKLVLALISTAFLVGGTLAYAADAPPESAPMPRGRAAVDCAKAADPAQCEARRKARRERVEAARKACEGKAGDDNRACMREQFRGRAGARKD